MVGQFVEENAGRCWKEVDKKNEFSRRTNTEFLYRGQAAGRVPRRGHEASIVHFHLHRMVYDALIAGRTTIPPTVVLSPLAC